MFLSYGTIEQWIGLGEYCLIISALFVFTTALSCILSNKTLHTKERKNNFRNKNIGKKSYFIDVA